MRRLLSFICAVALTAGGVASIGHAAAAEPSARVIVVLRSSVDDPGAVAAEHSRRFAAQVGHVYSFALKGYAATLPAAGLRHVESDPRVAFVTEDIPVSIEGGPSGSTQVLPAGIDRIDADAGTVRAGDGRGSVATNVAVLDSGIDPTHPDLNVVGGVNCSNGQSYADQVGHGTHVSGTIGAKDNGFGVVGVAPGARLWAVRVLDNNGSGSESSLLCGIDWVTGTRLDSDPANDIVVANMSIGGKGSDDQNCGYTKKDALHQAICRSTNVGVTYIVAAGNSGADFSGGIPASYDEVLVATAMADFDGVPGGLVPVPTGCGSKQVDDTAATFSNYATTPADQAHVVAAPGVCVLSTIPSGLKDSVPMTPPPPPGEYGFYTGTSMASPHVAGTVVLCIASGACAGMSPAQIIAKMVSDAAGYNTAHPSFGFLGDPLHSTDATKYYGYLVKAGLY